MKKIDGKTDIGKQNVLYFSMIPAGQRAKDGSSFIKTGAN